MSRPFGDAKKAKYAFFAYSTDYAIATAKALELDPDLWYCAAIRSALTGHRFEKIVVICPATDVETKLLLEWCEVLRMKTEYLVII